MYKVLTPIKVGPMEVKNRVMLTAMAKSSGNPDFTVSERMVAYYENFAKNGVGLLTTGACILYPDYPFVLPCQPGVYDDKFIPELKKLVDAVHKYGAKMLFQPWHPGYTEYGDPSKVRRVADYTVEEIHEMQNDFVQAAVRIQKAGADGVEMHVAHNYLMEQFLVPLFNKRTDEYNAQTVESGLRFTVEMIESIKKACGPDFAVTVKINGDDFNPDGMTPERLALVGPLLEKAGADMIAVSAGGSLTDITGMSDNGGRPEGWKVPLAEVVKKSGVSIPVMATGSIRHPEFVEQVLSEGKCDMIGMGRGLTAEPEWVKKLEEGREDEMAACISCMACFNNPPAPNSSGCSVNPTSLREYLNIEAKKDGAGKAVVVVGGGPGGMQAAKTLAERGFAVTLFEKDNKLGGLENLAAVPFGKSKIGWHIDYLSRQLNRLGVDIRLGKEVTAEEIKAMNPYGVVIATGTIPTYPKSIPGIDKAHVIESRDLLSNVPEVTGENIVVIGTGLVGLETAMTLAVKGNKISVLDMIPLSITALDTGIAWGGVFAMQAGVYMEHKLLEITDDAVVAENMQSGEKVSIPANRVVLCMGRKANNGLYEELKGQVERLYNVGDSNIPDKILSAVQGGFDAAVSM